MARLASHCRGQSVRPAGRALPSIALATLAVINIMLVTVIVPHRHTEPARQPPALGSAEMEVVARADEVRRKPKPLVEAPLDLAGKVAMWAGIAQCGSKQALLSRSDDGGRTWRPVQTPASAILRVRVIDPSVAWFVGADDACRPRFYRTADGGRSWEVRTSTKGAWHRSPNPDSRRLHTPHGLVAVPCRRSSQLLEVVGMTISDGAVLCGDGSVYRSSDRGVSWQRTARLSGARALDFPGPEVGFAAVVRRTCSGWQIMRSQDGGRGWRPSGCVEVERREGIALAFADPMAGLLTTPLGVFATSDGGRTWSPRGSRQSGSFMASRDDSAD